MEVAEYAVNTWLDGLETLQGEAAPAIARPVLRIQQILLSLVGHVRDGRSPHGRAEYLEIQMMAFATFLIFPSQHRES
jgi:hypothetical protein